MSGRIPGRPKPNFELLRWFQENETDFQITSIDVHTKVGGGGYCAKIGVKGYKTCEITNTGTEEELLAQVKKEWKEKWRPKQNVTVTVEYHS